MSFIALYREITIFLLGACLGSFFNVIGMRLPLNQSLIFPPSHCDSCQHKLKKMELIPVVSYILLKGKCKNCQAKIAIFHPLIELMTAVFFVMAYIYFDFSIELIIAWLFISLLAIITVSDILYTIILDKVLLFFGLVIFILRICSPLNPWWDMLTGAFFGFSLLLLLAISSKGGMGGGDIKLYFIIGLVLGIKLTLVSLFLSAVIGLLVAVVLKRGFGKIIPFGPSIAIGSLLAYFWGRKLLEYYIVWII